MHKSIDISFDFWQDDIWKWDRPISIYSFWRFDLWVSIYKFMRLIDRYFVDLKVKVKDGKCKSFSTPKTASVQ